MLSRDPKVSVIIPAYEARDFIGRAIRSVASCGIDDYEIVVASDDGTDYGEFRSIDPNIIFTNPGPVSTGAGAARNRAIARAKGEFVAFLDADDTWSEGYLAAALSAGANGPVFGSTSVFTSDGHFVATFPRSKSLNLRDVGSCGASFHPVLPRELAGPFLDIPSEDVLHSVEVLSLCGGTCRLAEGMEYRLNLRDGSVTDSEDFTERVSAAYNYIIRLIKAGKTRIPSRMAEKASQVFLAKGSLNDRFAAEGGDLTFYEYVSKTVHQPDIRSQRRPSVDA